MQSKIHIQLDSPKNWQLESLPVVQLVNTFFVRNMYFILYSDNEPNWRKENKVTGKRKCLYSTVLYPKKNYV